MNIYNDNKFKKNKGLCGNCGKYGHIYSKCFEPIISIGIINFKVDKKYNNYIIKKFNNPKNKNIIPLNNNINCTQNKKALYLQKFCILQNNIKFLLIRRKNTLGYIEFIRGRYDPTDADSIINLFQQMVKDEINMIKEHELNYLWDNLWTTNKDNKAYENEFNQSKDKFNKLKNGKLHYNLDFYINNIEPKYKSAEWGFPKGRRNYNEKNIDCANREYNEESGYTVDDYTILNNMNCLNETFYGTNNVQYKHIYYIGLTTSDKIAKVDNTNNKQFNEIGDIGWFTYNEAINIFRPYHKKRIKLLTQLYMFIINQLIEYELSP
jgi:8-oxo-dGTP pyrophosphatase MutT (NUDIX family)